MGTKNNPGAFDCYAAAHPDEPMFILLGRDRHAPGLVRLWAVLREIEGEDAAKVDEADACAEAMTAYHLQAKGKPANGELLFMVLLRNMATVIAEHDRLKERVAELISANNAEIERRRSAERERDEDRRNAGAPRGWKLMPEKLTREMWAAMGDAVIGKTSVFHDIVTEAAYRAAYAAAPPPPTAPQVDVAKQMA